MVAFFYVKVSGTAVDNAGREDGVGNRRSGPFEANANNFPSVAAVLATTGDVPVGGDFLICAHDSNDNPYSANTTLNGPTTGTPLFIVSVNEQLQDQSLAGFSEGFSTTNLTLIWNGNWAYSGIDLSITNEVQMGNNVHVTLMNGTLDFDDAGDRFNLINDGCTLELIDYNVDFNLSNTSSGFLLRGGNLLRMVGGSVISTTTGTVPSLISGDAFNGGLRVEFTDVDLSAITTYLVQNTGASVSTDNFQCIFDECQLSTGVNPFEENILNEGGWIRVTHCSFVSGTAEHQYYFKNYRGEVEDNTDTYRNASVAFPDSGTKISLKVTPNDQCDRLTPFIFDIPASFVELSVASTDTLQFFVTCGTELTNADIWAEVHYPDGTNKNVYNATSNAVQISGTYTVDPLAAGATLASDTTWTNSPLTFQQTFKVDTSGDVGSDSIPTVRIYVATTAVLHIDPVFDSVAS